MIFFLSLLYCRLYQQRQGSSIISIMSVKMSVVSIVVFCSVSSFVKGKIKNKSN